MFALSSNIGDRVGEELTVAKKHDLGDLRGAIDNINREVMQQQGNGEAPNAIVLSRLKSERKELIAHFAPQLIHSALTKLLNDVSRKRLKKNGASGVLTLFENYRGIPNSVTIKRGLKKDTVKLTISEADQWIRDHSTREVGNDTDDFRRLVDDCRRYAESEAETLERSLQRMSKKASVSVQLNFDDENQKK